jgi:Tol biopolymer transport system component
MRADGSEVRQLFASYPMIMGFAWSPDGRRIAAAQDLYPKHEIDVVNVDGTGEAVLVPDVRAADLAWSPDGRKLALRTQEFRIAIADIASGRVRALDTGAGEGVDSQPDWQPLP